MRSVIRRIGVVFAVLIGLHGLATPAFATYGGTNGKIAYTDIIEPDTPDARRAVFVDPGGQITHPMPRGANSNDNDSYPAWSPDGKAVAFIRRNGQTQEYSIYVVQADGTGLRRVAGAFNASGTPTFLNAVTPSNLSWSPDGRRIGFLFSQTNQLPRIGSVAAAGGPTPSFGQPWSPFSASPINGFDWGRDGFLYRCTVYSAPNTKFCSSDEFGNPTTITSISPAEAPLDTSLLSGIPRWAPDGMGGDEVMFPLIYSQPLGGQSIGRTGIFSLTPAVLQTGTDYYGTNLVRHTPAEETVSCTNTTGGTTTTTFSARYAFSNPIPSPDGKFIVVFRVENVTTTNPEGKCVFEQQGHGLYLLRDTGAVQRTIVASREAAQAAWQASPANLTVTISDGHGNGLDGLLVDLRRDDDNGVVDSGPVNTSGGVYSFLDVPPGRYRVRATLSDLKSQGFQIHYTYPAEDPVWAERQILVPADAEVVEARFTLDQDHIVDSNVGAAGDTAEWHRLDDMAVIYYNTYKFVQWVRSNLTENTGSRVPIYTFSSQSPNSDVDAAGALYDASLPGIFISTSNSEYENRDGILDGTHPDDAPLNVEWHEFSHHIGTQAHPDFCAGEVRISHGGYGNSSTCDSMLEGFATFLPAWATTNPDYSGIANLASPIKAWASRFSRGSLANMEDLAVAALLWDIVDSDAGADYTVAIGYDGLHRPTTYVDQVSLPLSDLWRLLTTAKPRTVYDLHTTLIGEPPFNSLSVDLDYDGIVDVSQIDLPFLMHGFFPVSADQVVTAGHQSWHYNVADARLNGPPGTPPNADVGLSSHYAYAWPGQVSATFIPRRKTPVSPGANLDIRLQDASGSPLKTGNVDMTIYYPGSTQWISRPLGTGTNHLVHLELPVYFDYELPTGAPLPACDPATDLYIAVSVGATINGYASTDSANFDNCQYLQAMAAAYGPAAMTYVLNFPEDSMPPVTTLERAASGPVAGEYTSGYWQVALSCDDPVDADFASGCLRSEYSLDGGPYATYEDVVKVSEPGLHTFSYRSLDAASNEETVRTVNLGVRAGGDVDVDGVPDVNDNCVNVANADQRDTNGDGYGNRCDADFNNNGSVDSQDGAMLRAAFGSRSYPDRDLNGNGIVDSHDGVLLRVRFGQPPGPSGLACAGSVPCP